MNRIYHVHQFTPSVAAGDGVSQGLFYTQQLLRELGYVSTIYANHIDDALKGRVLHIDEYQASAHNILLYHHSIGHEHHDLIMGFPDHRVLVYHNITPSHFFKNVPHLKQACDQGREQLAHALPYIEASYADSDYNADELISLGYREPQVIPILVDVDQCLSRAEHASRSAFDKEHFNILFVGRIVSNKNQHQLVDVLYSIKQQETAKPVKLYLAGGVSEPDYMDFVNAHINALGLEDSVEVLGKVPDAELYDCMCSADLFLCLSEHEGFCMPILESICCGAPVLAYQAGGIATTLGEAGLLTYKASSTIADTICDYIKHPEKLTELHRAQFAHLQQFRRENLMDKLQKVLEQF